MDLITIAKSYFDAVLGFFLIKYPGTSWSFLQIALCVTLTVFVISVAKKISGFDYNTSYRGGNNKNIKINEKRRGDNH